jgi:hypothetical protein
MRGGVSDLRMSFVIRNTCGVLDAGHSEQGHASSESTNERKSRRQKENDKTKAQVSRESENLPPHSAPFIGTVNQT